MIKHTTFLLSFICFLISCHTQVDKSYSTDLLKGDWIGSEQSQGNSQNYTTFICFDDSTCLTSLSMRNGDIKYEIRKDTLCINGQANTKAIQLIRYIIVKLTTDSLVLRSAMSYQDTLQFLKVRTKNNITPAAIYFASSGCFGECPIMSLEIDSSRNIRYYGDRHTSITGGFSGRISEYEYNSIINKIRHLPIDSLHTFYETQSTDQETLGVSIVHGNKVTRSSAYGHDQEPMELHILFGKLINLYKHASLKSDTSVNQNYFLSKQKVMPDLLPPTAFDIQKFTPPKIEH
jgi:hypothetical protein